MNVNLTFEFCGARLLVDGDGALVWPDRRLLAVADLHFEKGSAFGANGTFLPPYDSRTTLQRLEALIDHYCPKTVLCLGDSFHDMFAADRMAGEDFEKLADLTRGREWVWIAGNHDPSRPVGLSGAAETVFELGPITFRHEATKGVVCGEISGHFHPKARLRLRGRKLSCRCFVTDGRRLILPAFGTYAGGLNVLDPAFSSILGRNLVVYVIRDGAVHTVGHRALVAEPELAKARLL